MRQASSRLQTTEEAGPTPSYTGGNLTDTPYESMSPQDAPVWAPKLATFQHRKTTWASNGVGSGSGVVVAAALAATVAVVTTHSDSNGDDLPSNTYTANGNSQSMHAKSR